MPGTPDPVLGSEAVTFAVACAGAAFVTALPPALRTRLPTARRLALVVGAVSTLLGLGAWAGARLVADAFEPSLFEDPLAFVGLLAVAALALAAQGALPAYLSARWRLYTPLAGLFALTTVPLFAFLRVRGESDPLALWALFFAPLGIVAVLLLALGEVGVRRFLGGRT
ncbi:hypothetical protein HUG10_19355 (plasmid) [Halorarum halophilum]|uniref:Uncharacterized protein n=1 Tax=Halorarum halophilum TaxID=2743090 RepID=A0A7D5L322_9EURY|nr:hypothetical protein [Halobaculum halophilum]QLG29763.1 hypothetical protein HUG10_19355 [Halobaculum halophilum]